MYHFVDLLISFILGGMCGVMIMSIFFGSGGNLR